MAAGGRRQAAGGNGVAGADLALCLSTDFPLEPTSPKIPIHSETSNDPAVEQSSEVAGTNNVGSANARLSDSLGLARRSLQEARRDPGLSHRLSRNQTEQNS